MNQLASIPDDEILTVPQVAKYLKIGRSKAYYMVSRKQLPYFRLGKNLRVRRKDLIAWIESKLEKVQ